MSDVDATRRPQPWISARWQEAVAANGDRPALEGEGRVLSFAELDRRVRVVAEAMTLASPDPTVPVAAVLGSRVDAVVAAYAGWMAGRPFTQITPDSPPRRVAELVEIIGATAVVADADHGVGLEEVGATRIDPTTLPDEPSGLDLHIPVGEEDGTLTFTSGTTGRPKGVVSSVESNATRTKALHAVYGFRVDDRVGLTLPPSFGASAFVLPAPLFGSTLCVRDPTEGGARGLAEWLAHQRITLLVVLPVLLRELLDRLPPGENLPELRIVAPMGDKVLGGDVLAARGRANPRVRIVGQYGATEVGPATVFDYGPDDDVPEGILPVGVPFPGVDVWIDDPDDRGVGKIVVRSPGLCRGYWGDPVLTDSVLRPDPDRAGGRVLVSGDHGRFDDHGRLVFMGRRDAMVKVRGLSIDLSEVERRLTGLESVREAIVSIDEPRPDRRRVVAHIVPEHDGLTVSAVRRELGEWLPPYMLPSAVVVCDAFPRNDRGKVLADQLPPVPATRPPLDTAFVAPSAGTEALVARHWQEVLGVAPVGVDDDLFELGGDSLTVVELVDRLSHELGVPLEYRAFDVPTVASLARRCDELVAGARPSPLVALGGSGEGAPLFIVHGTGGLAESVRELADAMAGSRSVFGLQPVGDEGIARLGSVRRTAEGYLAAIEAAHPSGPLLVGGLSGGGVLALEMARLLERRGRRPDAVVMLDTVTVGLNLPLRGSGGVDRRRVAAWARQCVAVAKREALLASWSVPVVERVAPRRSGSPEREHRALVALRSGRPLEPEGRRDHVEAMMRRGMRRWLARPYAGPVVVVRASEPGMTAGWADVAGDLTYVDVPGDHESFIRPPQVAVLVARLEAALNAIAGG